MDGGLVLLPSRGQLYIANDFHTRHADFARWLKDTDLVARLKGGEDVYGLVLGDVVDAKPNDPEEEKGGDLRMIERIRDIQRGPGGDRLIYVLGNHEYEVIRLYDAARKQLGMNRANQRRIVEALYRSELGAYFQQWNFIKRINDDVFNYLRKRPVLVLCRNGLVAVHAGPTRDPATPADVAQMKDEIVQKLVWNRPGTDYEPEHVADFLRVMDRSSLLIVGHTPLSSLPESWVRNGLCLVGDHAAVMAASYGALPGQKQYICIDLSKRYADVAALEPAKEIRPLEEKRAGAPLQPGPAPAERSVRRWWLDRSVWSDLAIDSSLAAEINARTVFRLYAGGCG